MKQPYVTLIDETLEDADTYGAYGGVTISGYDGNRVVELWLSFEAVQDAAEIVGLVTPFKWPWEIDLYTQ